MTVSTGNWFGLVETDLEQMTDNLQNLVAAKHPVLKEAAEYLFRVKGKRVRPAIVLLASRATASKGLLTDRHRRLAEITEMIHTAGLVHDDVIDTSDLRRGMDTVNAHFTNKIAVLAGDFLFAKSSVYLSRLGSLEVVELLATVLEHFGEGEILQSVRQFDPTLTFEEYIDKSFYKTASLLANSAKAAAVLSDSPRDVCEALYDYGKHLGIAFQVVDDILDFTGSTAVLGKPAGSDLQEGHLTAPALYALEEYPQLATLVEGGFAEDGDFETALKLIHASRGISRSRELAHAHARQAVQVLETLPLTPARQALSDLSDYVLDRLY
jgi:all-trans-nonaprenyl-diphosphate synthase